MWKNRGWLIALTMTVTAGCLAQVTLTPTPTLSPSSPRASTTPYRWATISPGPARKTPLPATKSPAPGLSEGTIAEQAREALADLLDIPSDEIEVMRVEEVEWPDTSLGCPEPGMVYTQVIVPGYRVVMRVKGTIYEYHTSGKEKGILCHEDGSPLSPR